MTHLSLIVRYGCLLSFLLSFAIVGWGAESENELFKIDTSSMTVDFGPLHNPSVIFALSSLFTGLRLGIFWEILRAQQQDQLPKTAQPLLTVFLQTMNLIPCSSFANTFNERRSKLKWAMSLQYQFIKQHQRLSPYTHKLSKSECTNMLTLLQRYLNRIHKLES